MPTDLDEDNDYAIFVKVSGDGYCNEDYVLIDIDKKKHEVIIESLKIEQEEGIVCGDTLTMKARVNNIGKKDEEVYFLVEIPKLSISERTELYELDEGDDLKIELEFKIPEDAKKGEYNLDSKIVFEDGKNLLVKTLLLGECKELDVDNSVTSPTINLKNNLISESKREKDGSFSGSSILVVFLVISGLFILGRILWWKFW